MMMYPKQKKIRLKSKAEREKLALAVYERDRHKCVNCGRWVPDGRMFHHEPPRSQGGQDILENAVLLCDDCHRLRHDSAEGIEIADKCRRYLEWMNDEII